MPDKSSLLPVAFYLRCQLDPVDLIGGVKRSESKEDTRVLVFSLSHADVRLCLQAKQTLLKASGLCSHLHDLTQTLLPDRRSEPELCDTCTHPECGVSKLGALRLHRDLRRQILWDTTQTRQWTRTLTSWSGGKDYHKVLLTRT